MKQIINILFFFSPILLFAQQQIICKGGFENSDPYNLNCSNNWIRGTNAATGRSDFMFGATSLRHGNLSVFEGNRQYAYLANSNGTGIDNGVGFVYQSITIPANTVALNCSFWASISTSETNSGWSYDSLRVGFWDTNTRQYVGSTFLSNLNGEYNATPHTYRATYIQYTINADASLLNNPVPKTLWFVISGYTDYSNPTVFRVDDVSVVATVNNCISPTITNPFDAQKCVGNSQIFNVSATNADRYEWQFSTNGNFWSNLNINSNQYFIPSVQLGNEGYYRCIAYRNCGTSVVSNAAYLQVESSPSGSITSIAQAQRSTQHFLSTSFDPSNNFYWTFQNATPTNSSSPTPSVIFNRLGTQRVNLTVSNFCGSRSVSQDVSVGLNPVLYPKEKQLAVKRSKRAADPIIISTGAYTHTERGVGFSGLKTVGFEYTYNSRNLDIRRDLGFGWQHNFDYWLEFDPNNTDIVTAYYAEGHRVYYFLDGTNSYRLLYADVADSLIRNQDLTFTLLQRDSSRMIFDMQGKLTKMIDPFDNETTLSYQNGKLWQVSSAGRQLTFNFVGNNLQNVTDGIRTVRFNIDGQGDLTHSIVEEGVNRDTMRYDYNNHEMIRLYDPRGTLFLRNVYQNGHVVEQYDAYSKLTRLEYITLPNDTILTRMTEPLGKITEFKHDNNFNHVAEKDAEGYLETFNYEPNGALISALDKRQNVTNFTNNYHGEVTTVTNALNRTMRTDYNNLGLPSQITDLLQRRTRFFYRKNRIDSIILPNNGTIVTKYNTNGTTLSIKDPKSNLTNFGYNSFGDMSSVSTAAGTQRFGTDNLGRTIWFQEGDDMTKRWRIEYNLRDQITRVTSPMQTYLEKIYDKNGNLIRERDFSGYTSEYEYDLKDRLVLIRNPKRQTTRMEYDDLDRITRIYDAESTLIWRGGYNRRGDLERDTTPLGITKYEYETNQLLRKVTNAIGKSVEFRYNALNLPDTLIDELGRKTALRYNNGNELIRETYPDGTYYEFEYSTLGLMNKARDILRGENKLNYDLVGNLDTVINARNKQSFTIYDNANRPIQTFDGVTTERFGYTMAGLDTIWDGNNVRSIVTRNKNNEVVSIARTDGSFEQIRQDNDGFPIFTKNETDSMTIERDSLHLPITMTNSWGNTIRYGWSATQNVTRIVYPSGNIAAYSYIKGTNLVDTIKWNGRVVAIYTYDSLGRVRLKRLGNGTTEESEYDAVSNLTLHRNRKANGETFQQNRRQTDIMNRFTTDIDTLPPLIPNFKFGTQEGVFGSDDGMTRFEGTSLVADGNGNILSVGNTESYTWRNNRLLTYRRGQDSAQIFYDAEGLKIKSLKNGQEYRFIYDRVRTELPTLLEIRNGQNQLIESYVLGAFGEPILRDSAGTLQYYHFDTDGNTIALTNSTSQITDRYTTDNFGSFAKHEGATVQPFQFLGMYGVQYEAENLYYVRERWLDANHNRFLSKDPFPADFTNTQSNNRFIYALNSPVSWVDASGLKETSRFIKFLDKSSELLENGKNIAEFSSRYLLYQLNRNLEKYLPLMRTNKVYIDPKGVTNLLTKYQKLDKVAKVLGKINQPLEAINLLSTIHSKGLKSNETMQKTTDLAFGYGIGVLATAASAPLGLALGGVYLVDSIFFDGSTSKNILNGVKTVTNNIRNVFKR